MQLLVEQLREFKWWEKKVQLYSLFSTKKTIYDTKHWLSGEHVIKNPHFTPKCSPDVSLVGREGRETEGEKKGGKGRGEEVWHFLELRSPENRSTSPRPELKFLMENFDIAETSLYTKSLPSRLLIIIFSIPQMVEPANCVKEDTNVDVHQDFRDIAVNLYF